MRKLRETIGKVKNVLDADEDSFALFSKYSDISCKVEMQPISNPRASSLYDSCMRMHVIGSTMQIKQKRFLNLHAKTTFGIGDGLHYQIQNTEMVFNDKQRVGWWLCVACQTIRSFGIFSKTKCKNCNALPSASIYFEHALSVYNNPVIVTGHPDLFISISNGLIRVVEIKSLKKDSYVNLVMPLIAHQWQIITYLMYCNKSTTTLPVKIDEDLGYILYVAKEQTGRDMLPMRLYPVKNDHIIRGQIMKKLRAYYTGIKNWPKDLPQVLTECSGSGFKGHRAKYCPTKGHCKDKFSGG